MFWQKKYLHSGINFAEPASRKKDTSFPPLPYILNNHIRPESGEILSL